MGQTAHVSTEEEHPVYLPAYVYNFGLTDGWADLMDALRTLRASKSLRDDEQREIERVLQLVEKAVYRT